MFTVKISFQYKQPWVFLFLQQRCESGSNRRQEVAKVCVCARVSGAACMQWWWGGLGLGGLGGRWVSKKKTWAGWRRGQCRHSGSCWGAKLSGEGEQTGRGSFLKLVCFFYVATHQSASQQSTLRKLDRVKEFLWEESKKMKVVTWKWIQTVLGGRLIMSSTRANTELRPKANWNNWYHAGFWGHTHRMTCIVWQSMTKFGVKLLPVDDLSISSWCVSVCGVLNVSGYRCVCVAWAGRVLYSCGILLLMRGPRASFSLL